MSDGYDNVSGLRSENAELKGRVMYLEAKLKELEKELGWAAEWYGENWIYNDENRSDDNVDSN